MVVQRLAHFLQLFSWTSVGPTKCPINKMIASQPYCTVWGVPWLLCVQAKNSFTEMVFEMKEFLKLGIVKKFIFFYVNLASILWLLLDQRLAAFHQLFIWTSDGSSKFLINKIIVPQRYLAVWAVPRLPCLLAKNYFTENFFEMNKISNQPL